MSENKKPTPSPVTSDETAVELQPGDFALVFHQGGNVEVFQADAENEEKQEEIRHTLLFIEFALNNAECWKIYAEDEGEDEGEEEDSAPIPKALLN